MSYRYSLVRSYAYLPYLSRFHAWSCMIETTRVSWSFIVVKPAPQHGPIKSTVHRPCSCLSIITLPQKHAHLPTLRIGSGIERFANLRTLNFRFTDMNSRCPCQHMYLKGELEYARHSGISAMKFIQCAFKLSDDELQDLKKSIEDVSLRTSDEYSTFRE